MMRSTRWTALIFILGLLASCQSSKKPETSTNNSQTPITSVDVNNRIREQKKQQAAHDIPIRGVDYGATLERVGFASCLDQSMPTPILKTLNKEKFDLLLMMGDNIYATLPETKPIGEQYRKLLKNEDFIELRMKVPMLAIWDDNDIGEKDAGGDSVEKEVARREFLNFWPYVKNSIPRNQQALYHSKIIGPAKKDVHFILLDTRWDRSALKKNPDNVDGRHPYIGNDDKGARILSEAQWQWLEKELQKPARVKILISSIQLIADGHGFEKWGNFPKEKARLYELIKRTQPRNFYVLSGDRHFASLSKTQIKGWGTLYEIASSSLNKAKNLTEEDPDYISPIFPDNNYGIMRLDWKHSKIYFDIHDSEGKSVRSLDFKIR